MPSHVCPVCSYGVQSDYELFAHLYAEHEQRSALETAFINRVLSLPTTSYARTLVCGKKNRATQPKKRIVSNSSVTHDHVADGFGDGVGIVDTSGSSARRVAEDDALSHAFDDPGRSGGHLLDFGSGSGVNDLSGVVDTQRETGSSDSDRAIDDSSRGGGISPDQDESGDVIVLGVEALPEVMC